MKKVILWFTLLISLQIIVTYMLDYFGGAYNVTIQVPVWYNILYVSVFTVLFIFAGVSLIKLKKA